MTQYDVLIVGAGLSGIGAACHLARECPDKKVGIIERRNAIGGTWDLFRYPGIRSDTDMLCFGFEFRPWRGLKVMGDGPVIRQYIADTAREYGVDERIEFGLKMTHAAWSSQEQRWTVRALHEASGETRVFYARMLIGATGYYNYDQGYLPRFPGEERFKGLRIHPQHWPERLDYRGKKVVVIGSGATAVTLVPALAMGGAGHVTMLQRSPSYILSIPNWDRVSAMLKRVLPQAWVFALARKRNILIQRALYLASMRWPRLMRRLLIRHVHKQLGDGYDMSHFTPRYMPWQERLCAVPDADLFTEIRKGRVEVVTDHIETFTETGIELKSGRHLDADIIVTATGLQVQLFGGAEVSIDGHVAPPSSVMTYKAVMLQNVPNLAFIVGYTNAPWTLKADIACKYVCRLLQHMDAKGYAVVTPRAPAEMMESDQTILGSLMSGYVRRAADALPRQGKAVPWRVLHHYGRDKRMLLDAPIEDPYLEFTPARVSAPAPFKAVA
ncbi:flavin-containing monooxygenase [Sinimarinibacterium thermocellulolyticum]|uniref:NAD(P)/FAD-dependent oxidoreductase n=1 Tax=Sinimarinibacterium thermocellulolyticum TaxID=3170016 RepID=A0ABV2AA85_9GAMM